MDEESFGVAALRAADLHGAASRWPVDEDGGHGPTPEARARRPATGQALPLAGVRACKRSPMTGLRRDAKAMGEDDGRARLGTVRRRIAGAAPRTEEMGGRDRAGRARTEDGRAGADPAAPGRRVPCFGGSEAANQRRDGRRR